MCACEERTERVLAHLRNQRDELQAECGRLWEARDNWHTAYVREHETSGRLREQLDTARQALERFGSHDKRAARATDTTSPDGVTMGDWMELHLSPGFYDWLNALHGCARASAWRLDSERGWCGV